MISSTHERMLARHASIVWALSRTIIHSDSRGRGDVAATLLSLFFRTAFSVIDLSSGIANCRERTFRKALRKSTYRVAVLPSPRRCHRYPAGDKSLQTMAMAEMPASPDDASEISVWPYAR